MEQYIGMIVPAAIAIGVPPHEYDEAYSEGLVALVTAHQRYDPSRGMPLGAYIWQQLKYRLRDWFRREGRFHDRHTVLDEYTHDREDYRRNGIERLIEVMDAIRQDLTQEEQIALLGAAEGYMHWELSRALKQSGGAVSTLQSNARLKLHQSLSMI